MSPLPKHTAILVFSRTASAEARAKNYFSIHSQKHNRHLAVYLIQQAVKTVRQSSLPFFVCTEKEQRGTSFGERLSNALTDVFAAGYQKVVVIGNDCLQLKSSDLTATALKLEKTSLVITPTRKGGVSLIGISAEHFDKEKFKAIAWQTESVKTELLQYAKEAQLSIDVLPEVEEINNHLDLKKQLNLLQPFHSFFLLALSLLSSIQHFYTRSTNLFLANTSNLFFGLRAPPSCC